MNSNSISSIRKLDELIKSFVERTGASISLIILSPVMLLVGLAIKLESPGPALFRSRRLGINGLVFECLKYRTMIINAPAKLSLGLKTVVEESDPRVTRIGKCIRWGFDELPQLLNVIKGEMAIVGPRPDVDWIWPYYTASAMERLSVKPGITGLAVVLDSKSLTVQEGFRIDIWYSRNRNLILDTLILLATPIYVIFPSWKKLISLFQRYIFKRVPQKPFIEGLRLYNDS